MNIIRYTTYILAVFFLLCANRFDVEAQGFSNSGGRSIGVRLGPEIAIIFKQHNEGRAFEGILNFNNRYTGLTGLYHFFHKPLKLENLNLENIAGLDWFLGAGGHILSARDFGLIQVENRAVMGVDVMVGMQYNLPDYPFNVAIDFKPFLHLNGPSVIYSLYGLSLRYRFQ